MAISREPKKGTELRSGRSFFKSDHAITAKTWDRISPDAERLTIPKSRSRNNRAMSRVDNSAAATTTIDDQRIAEGQVDELDQVTLMTATCSFAAATAAKGLEESHRKIFPICRRIHGSARCRPEISIACTVFYALFRPAYVRRFRIITSLRLNDVVATTWISRLVSPSEAKGLGRKYLHVIKRIPSISGPAVCLPQSLASTFRVR